MILYNIMHNLYCSQIDIKVHKPLPLKYTFRGRCQINQHSFTPHSYRIGISGELPRLPFTTILWTSPTAQRLRYAWVRTSGFVPPNSTTSPCLSDHEDIIKSIQVLYTFCLQNSQHIICYIWRPTIFSGIFRFRSRENRLPFNSRINC